MSKPPEPSSSSRACTFTSTSSPSSTGPVSDGYAMQAPPSTSQRTKSACRSTTRETCPRLSESGIDQRERHVDHRLEVGHGDVLVGGMDVGHPVREIHNLEPALVEDVRIGCATRQVIAHGMPAPLERR